MRFAVSVKGVCVRDGRVLLLRNERDEWELPGGKLELGEDPADCVRREIGEETGWAVTTGRIIDCWQYHIADGVDVVIVTYGCHVDGGEPVRISDEHKEGRLVDVRDLGALSMPDGYRRSIRAWLAEESQAARG